MTRAAELQAIEYAIKAGLLQKIPLGATSGWDDLTFREKKSISWTNAKKALQVRTKAQSE